MYRVDNLTCIAYSIIVTPQKNILFFEISSIRIWKGYDKKVPQSSVHKKITIWSIWEQIFTSLNIFQRERKKNKFYLKTFTWISGLRCLLNVLIYIYTSQRYSEHCLKVLLWILLSSISNAPWIVCAPACLCPNAPA